MASMERLFPIKCGVPKKILIILTALFYSVFFNVFSQNVVSSAMLRFPVWFVMEEAPTLGKRGGSNDSVFSPATSGIRELAPFFIEGLVYGWEFSYTPSDNLRGVKEYFEIYPVVHIQEDDRALRFTDSYVRSDTSIVESWIEYDLTPRMVHERQRWHTASFPTIGGKGNASVFEGIESVRIACEIAAKNAVRDYARNIVKNKPKEINGKILLVDFPRYYIDAGKYVADLDFFLNVSKIVEYTKF